MSEEVKEVLEVAKKATGMVAMEVVVVVFENK